MTLKDDEEILTDSLFQDENVVVNGVFVPETQDDPIGSSPEVPQMMSDDNENVIPETQLTKDQGVDPFKVEDNPSQSQILFSQFSMNSTEPCEIEDTGE